MDSLFTTTNEVGHLRLRPSFALAADRASVEQRG
jgi:hypothetical protein